MKLKTQITLTTLALVRSTFQIANANGGLINTHSGDSSDFSDPQKIIRSE